MQCIICNTISIYHIPYCNRCISYVIIIIAAKGKTLGRANHENDNGKRLHKLHLTDFGRVLIDSIFKN